MNIWTFLQLTSDKSGYKIKLLLNDQSYNFQKFNFMIN